MQKVFSCHNDLMFMWMEQMSNKYHNINNSIIVSIPFMHLKSSTDIAKTSSETWKCAVVFGGQIVSSVLIDWSILPTWQGLVNGIHNGFVKLGISFPLKTSPLLWLYIKILRVKIMYGSKMTVNGSMYDLSNKNTSNSPKFPLIIFFTHLC